MKNNFLSTKTGLYLTALVCCLLWGSAFPTIKTGYDLLKIENGDTFSIMLFAGVRFFGAGILAVGIFSAVNRRLLFPKNDDFKKISVLSVFQTVLQYFFFYLGLAYTSGSRGSVINASSVFFALIISSLVFKFEKLSVKKILGAVIGFLGVILISLDAFNGEKACLSGDFFILLSSLSYAFSSVFMRKYSKDSDPAMLSGYQFILGGAVMITIGLAFGGKITEFSINSLILIIYLMLVSAVAYSLWSILLKYNDVSKVAVCGFMTPVFGYFLSLIFDDSSKSVGALGLVSLVLVVLGIIVVNFQNKKEMV